MIVDPLDDIARAPWLAGEGEDADCIFDAAGNDFLGIGGRHIGPAEARRIAAALVLYPEVARLARAAIDYVTVRTAPRAGAFVDAMRAQESAEKCLHAAAARVMARLEAKR